MIVHLNNIKEGGLFVAHYGFTVCTGARYLGGYIGDDESKVDWIKKRTEKWERKIHAVTKAEGK